MDLDGASAGDWQVRCPNEGQPQVQSHHPGRIDIEAVAPVGHYIALRLGFGRPVEEVNRLPSLWVEEYTRSGYAPFDPLIRWTYFQDGVCRWSEVEYSDARGIIERARAHNLNFGAVVSVHDLDNGAQRSFGIFSRRDREFTNEELDQLRAYVQARHHAMSPPEHLTKAELEALSLVRDGQRLKQVAWQLGITEGAVKQRLKSARLKLCAKTGAEAISRAATFGLI